MLKSRRYVKVSGERFIDILDKRSKVRLTRLWACERREYDRVAAGIHTIGDEKEVRASKRMGAHNHFGYCSPY